MSLFPAITTSEFGPLFRLLDDYDVHRSGHGGSQRTIRAFQPKFDVRETKDAYELHGELPGIEQRDVTIEFTDPHTLVIKGRVEREHSSGGPEQGRITGDVTDQQQQSSHKATVEDEGPESSKEGGKSDQHQDQSQQHQVAKKDAKHDQHEAKPKYWVTERSVGEFHRSFNFPSRVDQDNVKASLKNGILTVTVPKAAAHQAKKINIE